MKDAQLEEDLQALAKAFLLLKTEEECIAFLKRCLHLSGIACVVPAAACCKTAAEAVCIP